IPRALCLGFIWNALSALWASPVRLPSPLGWYLFSAPTENSPGARDLSRRNDGKADPRLEISRPRRQPIFLRTKFRAPFACPANTLNTYGRAHSVWFRLRQPC